MGTDWGYLAAAANYLGENKIILFPEKTAE